MNEATVPEEVKKVESGQGGNSCWECNKSGPNLYTHREKGILICVIIPCTLMFTQPTTLLKSVRCLLKQTR